MRLLYYESDCSKKKNAIESHESRSDLTIERAPMRLDGRRSSDHAFHCIIAFSSQTGYIYTARIRQFLFGHCWMRGKMPPKKMKKKQQLKAIWRTVERRPRRRPKICRSSRALSLLMIRRYSVSWSGTRRRHATQTPTGVSTSQQQSQSSDVLAAAARALNEWWMKSQQQQNFNIVYKYNINEKKLLTFQE